MIEDLVVIAAHGNDYVYNCVKSLGNKYKVLVVGSGNTMAFIDFDNVEFVLDCPAAHSTGKYLWSYWHYPAKNYFFMQDSMELIDDDPWYLRDFKAVQPERGCVAWAKFPMMWDNQAQAGHAEYLYGLPIPEFGVFGPIFYVSRKSLDELSNKNLLPPIPMNKDQAQGSERHWAFAFDRADMKVEHLHGFDPAKMREGLAPFKKTWVNRQ